MININVIDGRICGSYGDTPFSVQFTPELYEKLNKLAELANDAATMEEYRQFLEEFGMSSQEDYTELIQDKCEFIFVNRATGEFFLKHGETV